MVTAERGVEAAAVELDGERFAIAPSVRAQLESLPPVGDLAFWRRVATRERESADWLAAETLVVVLRRFLAAGATGEARRVAEEIGERWRTFILRHACRWFRSARDREDFIQEVYLALWAHLMRPELRFWEINFIHCLRLRLYDARRRVWRLNGGGREVSLIRERDDGADDDGEWLGLLLAEWPLEGTEDRVDLAAAVRELPEQWRKAVRLRYGNEWAIWDRNAAVPTVSRALGVTDRTVRTYLTRASAQMRERVAAPTGG